MSSKTSNNIQVDVEVSKEAKCESSDWPYEKVHGVLKKLREDHLSKSSTKKAVTSESKRKSPEDWDRPWRTSADFKESQKRKQQRKSNDTGLDNLPSKCAINEDNFCACGQNEAQVVRRLPQSSRVSYCADGTCGRSESDPGKRCQNRADSQKHVKLKDIPTSFEVQVELNVSESRQSFSTVPATTAEYQSHKESRHSAEQGRKNSNDGASESGKLVEGVQTDPEMIPRATSPLSKKSRRCCCCLKKYLAAAAAVNALQPNSRKCCKCKDRQSLEGTGQQQSCVGNNERRCGCSNYNPCPDTSDCLTEQRDKKGCQCSPFVIINNQQVENAGDQQKKKCCGQQAKSFLRKSICDDASPNPHQGIFNRKPECLRAIPKGKKVGRPNKLNQPHNFNECQCSKKPKFLTQPSTNCCLKQPPCSKYKLIASTTNNPCKGDCIDCPGPQTETQNCQNILINCEKRRGKGNSDCQEDCVQSECPDNPEPPDEALKAQKSCCKDKPCPLVVVNNTEICDCEEKWARVDQWQKEMLCREEAQKRLQAQKEREEKCRRHFERKKAEYQRKKERKERRREEEERREDERRWRRRQEEAERRREEREEARWAQDKLDREEDRRMEDLHGQRQTEMKWRKMQLKPWPSHGMACPELEDLRRTLAPVPLDGMNETFEYFCSEPKAPPPPGVGAGGCLPEMPVMQIQEVDQGGGGGGGVQMRFPQSSDMPKTCVCVRIPPQNCQQGAKVINIFAGGRRPVVGVGSGGNAAATPVGGNGESIPPEVLAALNKVQQIANPSPNSWLGSVGRNSGGFQNNGNNAQGFGQNQNSAFMGGSAQPVNPFMQCG